MKADHRQKAYTTELVFVILAIWSICAWYAWTKAILMDDAFIYLQIAKNILLQGTAQYYPIVDCTALLASSPLKLLTLLPSLALGWLLAPLPSLEAARLAFLFSGPLTGLVFLPLCRPFKFWLTGMILSGFFFLTTESGMQMEGLLLFWAFWSFLVRRFPAIQGQKITVGPADVWLLCIIAMSRIEYVLAPGVLYVILLIHRLLKRKPVLPLLLPPVITCLAWVLIALALDVWPIPATYLSKVLTGRLKLFSENFVQLLPGFTRDYFFGENSRWAWLSIPASFSLVVPAFLPRHLRRIWAGGGVLVLLSLGGAILLLYKAPGCFIWYYENLYIIFLTLASAAFLAWALDDFFGRVWKAGSIALLVLFLCINTFNKHDFDWDFSNQESRAPAYMAIARHHNAAGVYTFPGLTPMRLQIMEIGIASYFANCDAWMYDLGGLAQVRNLEGADQTFLARFYPASALCSGEKEQQRLDQNLGDSPPLRSIWHITPEDAWKVQDYLPEFNLGIN